MTRVLPLPAPARISTGPSVVSTASRCCGLSWSRKDNAEVAPESLIRFYRGMVGRTLLSAAFASDLGTSAHGLHATSTSRAADRSVRPTLILSASSGGTLVLSAELRWAARPGNPHFSRKRRARNGAPGLGWLRRRRGGASYEFECEFEDFSGVGGGHDFLRSGAGGSARCAGGRGDGGGLQGAGADSAWKSDGVSGGLGQELS